MVHAVSYGMYLAVGLLATLVWSWRLNRLGRLLRLLPVPVMLAGLYFSYTRSVWMGTGLGLLVVLGLMLRGIWRPLVLGGMVCAGLLVAATRMESLVSFERELPASYTGKSVELRGEIAYISWKMFLDHPLLGCGFDQYPKAKLPYLADRSTSLNLEATRTYVHHNTFLSLLTETGLVGLGLFLAVLALWGRNAWQLARNARLPDWVRAQGRYVAALGVYACEALFHEISYLSLDHALIFFLAGITTALYSQFVARQSRRRRAIFSPRTATLNPRLTTGAVIPCGQDRQVSRPWVAPIACLSPTAKPQEAFFSARCPSCACGTPIDELSGPPTSANNPLLRPPTTLLLHDFEKSLQLGGALATARRRLASNPRGANGPPGRKRLTKACSSGQLVIVKSCRTGLRMNPYGWRNSRGQEGNNEEGGQEGNPQGSSEGRQDRRKEGPQGRRQEDGQEAHELR